MPVSESGVAAAVAEPDKASLLQSKSSVLGLCVSPHQVLWTPTMNLLSSCFVAANSYILGAIVILIPIPILMESVTSAPAPTACGGTSIELFTLYHFHVQK